ncbi:unnamed protein product [Rhizoctonia solani]|uniref:Uncharacterized protein n=1 Tax=Rhizoctonia solani TaxID=456999 RepID=A0A8H3CMZ9_9AGAM|nr:unnamed protein product [Rhizoctonia solani]CAE6487575.1 unnamed protein product [Rhizoctonia solani]
MSAMQQVGSGPDGTVSLTDTLKEPGSIALLPSSMAQFQAIPLVLEMLLWISLMNSLELLSSGKAYIGTKKCAPTALVLVSPYSVQLEPPALMVVSSSSPPPPNPPPSAPPPPIVLPAMPQVTHTSPLLKSMRGIPGVPFETGIH